MEAVDPESLFEIPFRSSLLLEAQLQRKFDLLRHGEKMSLREKRRRSRMGSELGGIERERTDGEMKSEEVREVREVHSEHSEKSSEHSKFIDNNDSMHYTQR